MVSCPLAGRHPYPAPCQIWTAASSHTITAWPCLPISSSSPAVSCLNSSCSASEADLSGIGLGLLYEKPSLLSTLLSVRTLQDIPSLSDHLQNHVNLPGSRLEFVPLRVAIQPSLDIRQDGACQHPLPAGAPAVEAPAKISRVHADQPVPDSRVGQSHLPGPPPGCSGPPSCGGRPQASAWSCRRTLPARSW